jgi:hypothetical protein
MAHRLPLARVGELMPVPLPKVSDSLKMLAQQKMILSSFSILHPPLWELIEIQCYIVLVLDTDRKPPSSAY